MTFFSVFIPERQPVKLSLLRLFPVETARFGAVVVIIETQ
jgi:hypothetical protein